MSTDMNTWDGLVETKSKYLKQSDVGEDGVVLTVRGFKREMLDGDEGEVEKTIMYFREEEYKPMVLGPTNRDLLKWATGAMSPAEARGKKILVYADSTVSYGGKRTGGLRIKQAPAPVVTKPVSKGGAPVASTNDLDDDIPF